MHAQEMCARVCLSHFCRELILICVLMGNDVWNRCIIAKGTISPYFLEVTVKNKGLK